MLAYCLGLLGYYGLGCGVGGCLTFSALIPEGPQIAMSKIEVSGV